MNFTELADKTSGVVVYESDPEFDSARQLWNKRFDRTPDAVLRCQTPDDVVEAIRYANRSGVAISVKGGGHSYAANSISDGGLLLDLSQMKNLDVDAQSHRVVVGPGVTGGEMDTATQVFGMATPTPTVSSVGVIGAALGGGAGYLTRKYGLTLDNVISAEVVISGATKVRASASEHPDLFWAIRGGGGNFGIVTELELALHNVGPTVLSGQVIYPFDDARTLLRSFRDFMATAPNELQCYPFCFRVPPIDLFPEETHGQPVLDFVIYHEDPEALDVVAPLRNMAKPMLDMVGPAPYVDAQRAFDANLPKGQRYTSKAHDLKGLSDGAIDTMVEYVPRMVGALTATYFDPLGGAVKNVEPDATAYAGRDISYGFHIIAGWFDPVEDDLVIGWANEFSNAMSEFATGGVYVNLIADDESDRIPDAYGTNYQRLTELKQKWDPNNLFRSNYNIPPG